MRAIDDFLIDRVFQPLADRLAHWVSCYGIAAFLMTGFGLSEIADDVIHSHWIALLVIGPLASLFIIRAHRLDNQPARGVMPADRIKSFLSRCMFLLFSCPLSVVGMTSAHDLVAATNRAAQIAMAAAFYFMACRANPPREKRSTVWAALGSEA